MQRGICGFDVFLLSLVFHPHQHPKSQKKREKRIGIKQDIAALLTITVGYPKVTVLTDYKVKWVLCCPQMSLPILCSPRSVDGIESHTKCIHCDVLSREACS